MSTSADPQVSRAWWRLARSAVSPPVLPSASAAASPTFSAASPSSFSAAYAAGRPHVDTDSLMRQAATSGTPLQQQRPRLGQQQLLRQQQARAQQQAAAQAQLLVAQHHRRARLSGLAVAVGASPASFSSFSSRAASAASAAASAAEASTPYEAVDDDADGDGEAEGGDGADVDTDTGAERDAGATPEAATSASFFHARSPAPPSAPPSLATHLPNFTLIEVIRQQEELNSMLRGRLRLLEEEAAAEGGGSGGGSDDSRRGGSGESRQEGCSRQETSRSDTSGPAGSTPLELALAAAEARSSPLSSALSAGASRPQLQQPQRRLAPHMRSPGSSVPVSAPVQAPASVAGALAPQPSPAPSLQMRLQHTLKRAPSAALLVSTPAAGVALTSPGAATPLAGAPAPVLQPLLSATPPHSRQWQVLSDDARRGKLPGTPR